jgi:hypothetical protein
MAATKYQVFVSSTYEDLKAERDEVMKAVLELGHIPVGMEMFSAADEDSWKIIARTIEASDYFVVLVAHRYGSVDEKGLGYTEKEYDHATAQGVPTLGFVLSDSAAWPADRIERDEPLRRSLGAFKAKVRGRYVSFWENSDDLYGKVSIALVKQIAANPRPGWIRADQTASSPQVMSELARLSKENAELRARLEAAGAQTQATDAAATAWRAFFSLVSRYDSLPLAVIDPVERQETFQEVMNQLHLDTIGSSTEEFVAEADRLVSGLLEQGRLGPDFADFRTKVGRRLRGLT